MAVRGFRTFGRGVYRCSLCGRSTRNTGGDEEQLDMCSQCYECCSWDNHCNDNGIKADPKLAADRDRWIKEIAAKGGDAQRVRDFCSYLFA